MPRVNRRNVCCRGGLEGPSANQPRVPWDACDCSRVESSPLRFGPWGLFRRLLRFALGQFLLLRRWRRIARDVVQRLLEVADRFTQGGSNLGELPRPKHHQDDGKDDDEMHWLEETFEHVTAPQRRLPESIPKRRR